MDIIVGSTNPAKLEAVRLAFYSVWPTDVIDFDGLKVDSGVSNQPIGMDEAFSGALNRAKNALLAVKADYGVGIEGGIFESKGMWFEAGFIVVKNRRDEIGYGISPAVSVPPRLMELIRSGKELGEVSDIIFNTKDSKKKRGYFGIMTKDLITRTEGYKQGLIMALSRFITPEVFIS